MSHYLFSPSHVPYDCVIAGFGIIQQSVRMLPVRLHFVISRLLAGGALVSALCFRWFLAHRFLYGIVVVLLICCFCTFAIPIPWWYNVIIFLVHCKAYELIGWSPTVLSCFWLFCLFLFLLFSLFAFLLLHGDSSMDCVSIQFSSLLIAHGRQDWSCHRSNSLNLQNAIVFPVC